MKNIKLWDLLEENQKLGRKTFDFNEFINNTCK